MHASTAHAHGTPTHAITHITSIVTTCCLCCPAPRCDAIVQDVMVTQPSARTVQLMDDLSDGACVRVRVRVRVRV
jgi:hypothetical protein